MDPEIVTILLEIKADTAATRQAIEDLAGDHGRVTRLESAANRQWWYTVAVGPAVFALHSIARKLGVAI
jgi:hypothetical protein